MIVLWKMYISPFGGHCRHIVVFRGTWCGKAALLGAAHSHLWFSVTWEVSPWLARIQDSYPSLEETSLSFFLLCDLGLWSPHQNNPIRTMKPSTNGRMFSTGGSESLQPIHKKMNHPGIGQIERAYDDAPLLCEEGACLMMGQQWKEKMWTLHKASLIISPFWNIVRNSLQNIIFETRFL